MKNMGKTTTVNLKVTPEFKTLLMQRAASQHRSMTAYIEWLVMQEARATGQTALLEPKNRRG